MNKSKADDERLYKRTRKWAIERDNGLCVLCQAPATEVHHILFRSRGGDSRLSNLACLCRACHNMAHGSYHEEVYETLKERIK